MAPSRSSRPKSKQGGVSYAKAGGLFVAFALTFLAGTNARGGLDLLFGTPAAPAAAAAAGNAAGQAGFLDARPAADTGFRQEVPAAPAAPAAPEARAAEPFSEGAPPPALEPAGGAAEPSRPEEVPREKPPAEEWVAAQAPSGGAQWIFCCGQWQDCLCGGRVRWGNRDKWRMVELPPGKEIQQVKCSIDKLGDPFPGDDGKHCQCEVTPGTSFFKSLNPGLLPAPTARLATSCEQFRRGAEAEGEAGRVQWESVQPFCDPSWADTEAGRAAKSGPRALSAEVLDGLMKSWIDNRFVEVHEKYFGKDGWVERAFVNYYAGPPAGKHAGMTEALIQSVHEFSQEPIIVFHFGVLTPDSWTKEKFPRLILLHATPMPANAGRSFNFNKMRAMILTKAKVGIQLDSDQFVAPHVDDMFKTTQREVTKEYPMPILPAHFLDRTPRDTGAYWARYCPKDNCKWQSQRWGHAHPTWTYWALPWLSRWLRGNLRDETLPVREGGSMQALRIVDVPEDEDLLNIGTWEDRGTKQWCKLDLPGPGDFTALLRSTNLDDGSRCNGGACGDITSDRRWHPHGVAKVFYTAHHAVDPAETRRYIKALREKMNEGKLPPPILYNGRFFKDGDSLRAAHPDVTCVI